MMTIPRSKYLKLSEENLKLTEEISSIWERLEIMEKWRISAEEGSRKVRPVRKVRPLCNKRLVKYSSSEDGEEVELDQEYQFFNGDYNHILGNMELEVERRGTPYTKEEMKEWVQDALAGQGPWGTIWAMGDCLTALSWSWPDSCRAC